MRAYIVKPGTVAFEFSEESAGLGRKGKKLYFEREQMFTEVLMDPVSYANGRALDPELYPGDFAHRMSEAARLGWAVFANWHDSKYVAVPYSKCEVH